MTNNQLNALNKLIGITRSYKGENFTFVKFKENDGVVTVFTTKRNLNLLLEEVDGFLQNLQEPVSTAAMTTTQPANAIDAVPYLPSETNNKVKEALLDALARVQGDPNFIPQAKAVVDISNAMVNIQKTELQAIGVANRKK